MTRRRGELYHDVLAVMPPGMVLSTPTIAAAVPNVSRALVGVTLCRCQKKGLVVRTDAVAGTQTGTRPATWMATGKPYQVGKGGGKPQPHRPHSRHKPKPTPTRPRTQAEKPTDIVPRETLPGPEAETVAQFIARGGRIEGLPGSSYVPSTVRPCGLRA